MVKRYSQLQRRSRLLKAKISPSEKTTIDSLQRQIDNLYRKKEYTEAEKLEESLENLLSELEAREEYLNIESYVDDEGVDASLEEDLSQLFYAWDNTTVDRVVGRYSFEDPSYQEYINKGYAPEDIPSEIDKSEDVFVGIFRDLLEYHNKYRQAENPIKENITFEEAYAAAKDAYEVTKARRDRTRKLLYKGEQIIAVDKERLKQDPRNIALKLEISGMEQLLSKLRD